MIAYLTAVKLTKRQWEKHPLDCSPDGEAKASSLREIGNKQRLSSQTGFNIRSECQIMITAILLFATQNNGMQYP